MNTAKQDESYLIRYRTNIMSRLKSIDLFLKTKSSPYCKKDVAELLGITYEELDKITDELKIKNITRSSFMLIMKKYACNTSHTYQRRYRTVKKHKEHLDITSKYIHKYHFILVRSKYYNKAGDNNHAYKIRQKK